MASLPEAHAGPANSQRQFIYILAHVALAMRPSTHKLGNLAQLRAMVEGAIDANAVERHPPSLAVR